MDDAVKVCVRERCKKAAGENRSLNVSPAALTVRLSLTIHPQRLNEASHAAIIIMYKWMCV